MHNPQKWKSTLDNNIFDLLHVCMGTYKYKMSTIKNKASFTSFWFMAENPFMHITQ